MGFEDGIHYSNPVNPSFEKLNLDSAFNYYNQVYNNNIISLTNGIFFESETESLFTTLSYPLKYQGEIISSGKSSFSPKTGNYPLKVLTIEDSFINLFDYNYDTGYPLSENSAATQIVTLHYKHHPNVIEFPEIKNGFKARYHLISAVDNNNDSKKETLYIISSSGDISIFDLAEELKRINNKISDNEILTLDGGGSISVQDGNGKDIIKTKNDIKVPVYFGFHEKKTNYKPKIKIINPKRGDVIQSNKPYFIFWLSSVPITSIELFQEKKLISVLEYNNEMKQSLFVWIPENIKGDNYRIKISSGDVFEFSEYFSIE